MAVTVMKKIVYVSNADIPSNSASSVHVMKMCEAFQKTGTNVTLVIPNHFNRELHRNTDIFEFYGVSKRFPVKRIRLIRKDVKGLREICYTVLAVLYAIMRRPDVIMTRKIMAARVASMLGFPYILELHTSTEPRHYSLRKTLQSKYMKKLIVISESLKKHMMEAYGIDESKILVLADAVDISQYEELDLNCHIDEKVEKGEPLKIAYVGSLYPGKGIETIVRMAAQDRKNIYDVYGARGPMEKWEALKEELSSTVEFHGQIANALVPQTLEQYDVVLMPYSNKVEVYGEDLTKWMSPLKMFEYMASGRVIISSNLPVIREILTDRENAYLVEPDNPKEWLRVIEEIEKNPEQAEQIAQRAKEAVKNYTWDARAKKVSEI